METALKKDVPPISDEQTKMNTALWGLLKSKIVKHGDVGKLAEELGLSRQTLRNIEKNRNYPSSETMGTIKRLFPNFSTDVIYMGKEKQNVESTEQKQSLLPTDFSELVQIRIEMAELRNIITLRDATIEELRKENAELKAESKEWQKAYRTISEMRLGIDREGIKIKSSSQAAVKDQIKKQEMDYLKGQEKQANPIGFEIPVPVADQP